MNCQSPVAAVVAFLIYCVSAASVSGQEWGNKMLDKLQIDFGNVARMSETTFKIKVTNPYVETIQITNLSTSCGCIGWLDQPPITIPSRGENELTIRLDTVRHVGEKHVRAFVTLSEPTKGLTALVQIPVNGRIRDDFEVRPGSINFGNVEQGQPQKRTVAINSAGFSSWKLVSAKSDSAYLTTSVAPAKRADGVNQYDVTVELMPDTPIGLLRDRLILTTNEPGNPQIAIPIEAKVEPDIVITDAHFGAVTQGRPKSVTVVIRGKKPIKIDSVTHAVQQTSAKPINGIIQAGGTNPTELTVDVADAMKVDFDHDPGIVHKLTLTLNPTSETASGVFDELYSIAIAGRAEPLSLHASGRVSSQRQTE